MHSTGSRATKQPLTTKTGYRSQGYSMNMDGHFTEKKQTKVFNAFHVKGGSTSVEVDFVALS
jgi:hypothetical protein